MAQAPAIGIDLGTTYRCVRAAGAFCVQGGQRAGLPRAKAAGASKPLGVCLPARPFPRPEAPHAHSTMHYKPFATTGLRPLSHTTSQLFALCPPVPAFACGRPPLTPLRAPHQHTHQHTQLRGRVAVGSRPNPVKIPLTIRATARRRAMSASPTPSASSATPPRTRSP